MQKVYTVTLFRCEMAELFAADLNVERLLMGIALHGGTSFPVGKVEFLNWYPLSFKEFLLAVAGERYAELLDRQDWQMTNDRGSCEVDFVVDTGEEIVPVEVKAEVNLKAKSLKTYRDKFHPAVSVRASMADYKAEEGLVNLPLYAVEQIHKRERVK